MSYCWWLNTVSQQYSNVVHEWLVEIYLIMVSQKKGTPKSCSLLLIGINEPFLGSHMAWDTPFGDAWASRHAAIPLVMVERALEFMGTQWGRSRAAKPCPCRRKLPTADDPRFMADHHGHCINHVGILDDPCLRSSSSLLWPIVAREFAQLCVNNTFFFNEPASFGSPASYMPR